MLSKQPPDGGMSMAKKRLIGNDEFLQLVQQTINAPSANGYKEVIGMFICEAQLQHYLPNHLAIAREFQASLTCSILLPKKYNFSTKHLDIGADRPSWR